MPLQIDPEFAEAAGPILQQLGQLAKPAVHDVAARRHLMAAVTQQSPKTPIPDDMEHLVYYAPTPSGDFEVPIHHYRKKRGPVGPDKDMKAPAVVHVHGGGFISLSVKELEGMLVGYVLGSGVQILSIDYRLAPEHPYPVPMEDSWTGLQWVYTHAEELSIDAHRIAVMGESAGAGLAASLALMARDRSLSPPLAKQILVYPMLDDRAGENHAGDMVFWTPEDNITGWTAYLGKDVGTDRVEQYAAPARAESVEGLPPMYIDCGQLDIFAQEDTEYVLRFVKAGIPVEFHLYPGLPHGFEGVSRGSQRIQYEELSGPSFTYNSNALTENVSNKVAIVTGAARGIGFATANILARHGARVVLVDLHEDALKSAVEAIGLQATYKTCDVSDWDQQIALFQWVIDTVGPVKIVVCNAAINPEISLLQTQDPERQAQLNSQARYNYLADETKEGKLQRPSTQLFDVNINSVVFGLKLAIHHMKQGGTGGRIVVTGSAGSYLPVPSQPLYTASKHAVLGLVRSTALIEEVIRANIAISWIAPWLTLTSMVEGLEATTQPHTLKSSPEDVAWAIAAAVASPTSWANAKGFWVQGTMITEVEGAYGEVGQRLIRPENQF
ncbi:alpha/beta hydrolase fold-domain-containing protein [Aspergillus caelatus]|uniref:Alpha/beta hydrolase fold-domain-containing protein n=1 Tax=Aspergillus caelatus TaxID=61420 RepID=A0A5N7AJP8_9EURO|nr:alpha/beta hydrolase fold-domain-containing protein [Aspergillus caelatus]KAE8370122.1 alpha/beta hydrolase fold-domain-containing protein [Aspergillus caelatus]